MKEIILFLIILSMIAIPIYGVQNEDTLEYINNYNLEKAEVIGSDYANPKYTLFRVNKPVQQIDIAYDYDYARLYALENKLKNVDRTEVLKHIFDTATAEATNNKEKHLMLLKFIHKTSYHNIVLQAMWPAMLSLYDPLILLELNELRCGQVARVVYDLFVAAGYNARVCEMAGHIIAEVYYDGGWHYIDGDIFGNGETVLINDNIPSWAELSQNPYMVDKLNSYFEFVAITKIDNIAYPAYFFFSEKAYISYGLLPRYIQKAPSQDPFNYGWGYFTRVTATDITKTNFSIQYQPSQVKLKSVTIEQDTATVEWYQSSDLDNDLWGYRVYVGSTTRNWEYQYFNGDNNVAKYWTDTNGWKPEMYENMFQVPPHDLGLITTTNTSATVPIGSYVTIMPYDSHGQSVGKELYFMSNELYIR